MLNPEVIQRLPSQLSPLPGGRTPTNTMSEHDPSPDLKAKRQIERSSDNINLIDGTVIQKRLASNLYFKLTAMERDMVSRSSLEHLVRKVYEPTHEIPNNCIDYLTSVGLMKADLVTTPVISLVKNMYNYHVSAEMVDGKALGPTPAVSKKGHFPWNDANTPFMVD